GIRARAPLRVFRSLWHESIGVSVLRRRPHGFDGFGLRLVAQRRSNDLFVAKLVDVELMDVDRNAARLAMPDPVRGADHGIPCIYVLLDIGTKLIESSHPKAPYLSNGRSALHRGGLVGATQEILHLGVGR